MKEYTSKNKEMSHTLNSRSATVNPPSVLEVLQTYRYPMLAPNVFQSKSKLMEKPPIQCKIGMEFQSVGGAWNVKKVPAGVANGTTKKIPSNLSDCDHGEEIRKINGLSVQTDSNDLEYVTSAFDEKTEKNKLLVQIRQAAATHKLYTLGRGYALLSSTPNGKRSEWISELSLIKPEHNGWWIINGKGEKSAHPQATVGVELENIDAFIEKIMSKVTDIKSKDGRKNKRLIQGPMSNVKVPFDDVRSTINAARKSVPDFTDKAKGFAHIVMQYVRMTTLFLQKQKVDNRLLTNAKNAMVFMSRTSLDALYKLLNEQEQNDVINFFESQKEYKNDSYLAYENSSKERKRLKTLTFKTWVDELKTKKNDMLVRKYHSVSEIGERPDKKTEKKYGVKTGTDIGDTRSGVIMELRALTRNVEPDKWESIATMILDILNPPSVAEDWQKSDNWTDWAAWSD